MNWLNVLGGAAPQIGAAVDQGISLRQTMLERQRQQHQDEQERQDREQRMAFARAQEARATAQHQHGLDEDQYKAMTTLGQSQVQNRQFKEAAGTRGRLSEVMGRLGYGTLAPIAGGTKMAEGPRPSPEFQGPMPATRQEDFNNPQTVGSLRSGFGMAGPKVTMTKVGHTVGLFDEDTRQFTPLYTEPDQMAEYRKESLDLKRELGEGSLALRQQVHADALAHRGGAGKESFSPALMPGPPGPDGQPTWLAGSFNRHTGSYTSSGQPAAKQPKGTGPKAMPYGQAYGLARKSVLGDGPFAKNATPAQEGEIKRVARQLQRESTQAPGGGGALLRMTQGMAAEAQARKKGQK